MGTRGLTVVVLDNECKVSQYGQWDHYPEGQGATILNFLSNEMDREKFEAQLRKAEWITEEEHDELWKAVGRDPNADDGWVTFDLSDKFKRKNPQLNRDMGGEVLAFVQNEQGVVKLHDSSDFATDEVSCEYVYVVNLDSNVFDVYIGTADLMAQKNGVGSPAKSFSLSDLPDKESFINSFKDVDEQREELADSVDALLNTLRQRSDDTATANHIANYIEANMDDFLEAVCPEE